MRLEVRRYGEPGSRNGRSLAAKVRPPFAPVHSDSIAGPLSQKKPCYPSRTAGLRCFLIHFKIIAHRRAMALQRYEEKTEYPYFSEEIFSSPCVLSHPSRKLFLPLHHKITRRRTLGDRMERGKSFCEQPPKNLRRISEESPKSRNRLSEVHATFLEQTSEPSLLV